MERKMFRKAILLAVAVSVIVVLFRVAKSIELNKEWFTKTVRAAAVASNINAKAAVSCPPPPPPPPPPAPTPQKSAVPPPPPAKYDFRGAAQNDPKLIEFLRKEVIRPPSVLSYRLKNLKGIYYSQLNQSQHANDKYLHGMRDGFYLEAGAVDGEYLSNSLFFEKTLGWRGLLVEPVPNSYKELLTKNRNAYTANVALATEPKASEKLFQPIGGKGVNSVFAKTGVKMKSIPLYSLLLALNVTVVDFLVLDLESFEVKVLKTMPWDKIKIRLMMIEFPHIPEGLPHLTQYLQSKGYKFLGKTLIDAWYGLPELLDPLSKTKTG